jgi:putative transcriptional regulator
MIMNELRSVTNMNSYGRITVHLKELMDEKKITRYRLAKLADTRFEVVDKWCSGTVERIDADVLARFCYILNCEITDIIKYDNGCQ